MKIIKIIGDVLPVPSYTVLIICFFLPFFTVTCSDTELLSVTGFEMMKGVDFQKEIKNNDLQKSLNKELDDTENEAASENESASDEGKQKPSIILIIPFVLGIVGLIFSFIKYKNRALIHLIFSGLIFICLLVFGLGIKNSKELNAIDAMGESSGNFGNAMGYGIISVNLGGAYFIACFFALLILFYFAFEIYIKKQFKEVTPKKVVSNDKYEQFLNKEDE